MLLRRISQNLRNQNWVAIVMDFVIVVSGVFLGMQVSLWNARQAELRDERRIIERLQEETATLLEVVRDERDNLQTRADLLREVQPTIFSVSDARAISDSECEAIAGSHVYRPPTDELPILDELISTGRFDRLSDGAIKEQLRSYILFRDRQRANHQERTNELFRLYSRHPDAVSVTMVPREDSYQGVWTWLSAEGYRWRPRCDLASMRSNQQFLNEFFDNSGRNGQVLAAYVEREEMLAQLLGELNALLES